MVCVLYVPVPATPELTCDFAVVWNGTGPLFRSSATLKVHYSEDRAITVRVSFRVRARDRFMVNVSRSRLVGLGLGIIGLGL